MKSKPWFHSALTTRLLAVALFPSLLLFTAMVLALFQLSRLDAESDARERGRLTAVAIAQSIQYNVISGNVEGLQRTLSGFLDNDPALASIVIRDADAVVLAEGGALRGSAVLDRFELPIERDASPVSLFDSSVSNQPKFGSSSGQRGGFGATARAQLGTVVVAVQVAPILAARKQRVIYALGVIGAAAMACLGVGLLLAQRVRRPFVRVMTSLRNIRDGHFEAAQLPITSPGEMGELEKVVNGISVSMNRSHHQQEDEIDTRTDELKTVQSALHESNRERGAVLARTNQLIEDERRKLSHEIHDRLNADLIAVKHAVQRIAQTLETHTVWFDTTATRYALAENLKQVETNIDGVYRTARAIVKSLRPEVLEALGLEEALRDLLSQFEKDYPPCSFSLHAAPGLLAFEGNVAITAYRVVQECLTNIVKHAQAETVVVAVLYEPTASYLTICVRDDGQGFVVDAPRESSSLGLIAIRERAESVNGKIRVTSSSVGTEVCLDLPVPTQKGVALAGKTLA